MCCASANRTMVQLVIAVPPDIGVSWLISRFHHDFISLEICPQRTQTIANRAVAIANSSRKVLEPNMDVSAMAANVDHFASQRFC